MLKDLPLIHSRFNQLKEYTSQQKFDRQQTEPIRNCFSVLKITFALRPMLDIKVILVRLRN